MTPTDKDVMFDSAEYFGTLIWLLTRARLGTRTDGA